MTTSQAPVSREFRVYGVWRSRNAKTVVAEAFPNMFMATRKPAEHEDLGFRALGQGLLSDLRRFRVRFARLQDIKGPWR